MPLVYLILFCTALLLSFVFTAVMIRLAPVLGLMDKPSARKIHVKPMPRGGGVGIIVSVFLVIGAIVLMAQFLADHPSLRIFDELAPNYLGGVLLTQKRLAVLAIGALVIAAMGMADDRMGLNAWVKLFIQIAVALFLAAFGVRVTLFLPWEAAGWAVTVVWLVFVMNAFNLLDNMDGLSSGVAFLITLVFFCVAIQTGQIFFSASTAVFAGAVLGFLALNFPPARIFMGDTGSYFLGYFLGVMAILFTYVGDTGRESPLLPFALPFILYAVPFYDTLSVIFLRLREGRHPFEADRRHFSHRLSDLGLSTRETALAIYAATLATAFPALYMRDLSTYGLIGAVVQAVLVLGVIAILEHAGTRKNRKWSSPA